MNDDNVKRLLNLPDKEFWALVDRDIRGTLPDVEVEAIRSDAALIERWYQALIRMKKSVEGTLGAKAADAKANRLTAELKNDPDTAKTVDAEHASWRAGAIRFKVGVEERLTVVRTLRAAYAPRLIESAAVLERNLISLRLVQVEDKLQTVEDDLRMLSNAIKAHRKSIVDDDDADPSDADLELWALVAD